jgi:hypothetical protein
METHVSALTSQITDRVRLGAERDSTFTKANAKPEYQPIESRPEHVGINLRGILAER